MDTFDIALPLQIRNPKVGLLFDTKIAFGSASLRVITGGGPPRRDKSSPYTPPWFTRRDAEPRLLDLVVLAYFRYTLV